MYNLLKQKNQQQTAPSKKSPVFNRTPLGVKSANALDDSPVTFNRFQQQVSNRPLVKPKKIKNPVQRKLNFNPAPRESKMLVDQTFIDLSEDRSAALNIEQDPLNSQNINELIFPSTATMKRSIDSKEGKVLNPDYNEDFVISKATRDKNPTLQRE